MKMFLAALHRARWDELRQLDKKVSFTTGYKNCYSLPGALLHEALESSEDRAWVA